MIPFIIIFFVVYIPINFYVFKRGWQGLEKLPIIRPFYTIAFLVITLGYIVTKSTGNLLPPIIYRFFAVAGAFWFAFLLYFILFLVTIDIIRLLESRFHFLPKVIYENYRQTKLVTTGVVVFSVCMIALLGYINKNDITVTNLNFTFPKGEGKAGEINIVMASDLHLSVIEGERSVANIVNKISSLNPDLVLLAGDIIDEKTEILNRERIGESFRKLKPKYGIYAISGNHDYMSSIDSCVNYLKKYNIIFLRDGYVLIDSSIYVIGREDMSVIRFSGKEKRPLEEIMKTTNNSHPKILLDHIPVGLNEAVKNKIDLQLSGHTHEGQMWPFNYITNLVYEISWGYMKKGHTHFYISSGAGLWGPPVRTGSKSEVVSIKIKLI